MTEKKKKTLKNDQATHKHSIITVSTASRKVSMMKFPAPEKKKPKLAFSANISGAMGRLQEKEVGLQKQFQRSLSRCNFGR